MLCGLWKVSRRADTICNSSVFPTQTTPAAFLGLSSFSVAVSFSKMLKSLKMSHHYCFECSTFLCVQKTRSGYALGSKKIHLRLVGTIQPCAYNCECLQAYCEEFLAWVGKGKKRWDTLLSGELTDVGVAALHFWLFWDPGFCLSHAQPKTYNPLYCCFSLSIRQALKRTFQDKCWNYFLNVWMEVCFRVIYSFGLLCFLAFPMRTASCLMTRLCNWGNALFLEESLQQPASAPPR